MFHGSPTLLPKTYEAPPPPTPESLNYTLKNSQDMRSIIVISNYGDNNNNKNNDDHNSETTNSTTASPSSRSEKLSLKNRFFYVKNFI